MTLKFVFTLLCALAFSGAAFAKTETAAKPAERKSDKAEKATQSTELDLSGRILQPGHSILGARAGQGGAFAGQLSAGINYEYLYSADFGLGAQLYHAAYSTKVSVGPINAEFSHRAITAVLLGSYHPLFIKVKSLDPYVSAGVAHTFMSSKGELVDGSSGALPTINVENDSTFLVASLNLRYFLDQHLSVVGTLNLGLSAVGLGVDYLF